MIILGRLTIEEINLMERALLNKSERLAICCLSQGIFAVGYIGTST